ncbi:hypothetical protein BT63DRAFT_425645 [Microthyrium microscopicum]|uniref:C2H2-type domain-containing protein n=1 Tax=Microthyrium microscopicum TaxID=703497 RepID=A0A6A6UAI6_9PEZI|nr:hypothetical protein BT63DRAFT_425645 [Microthyrium microscopicum]
MPRNNGPAGAAEVCNAIRNLSQEKLVECLTAAVCASKQAEAVVADMVITTVSYDSDETRSAASDFDPDEDDESESDDDESDSDSVILVDSKGVPTKEQISGSKRKRAESMAVHDPKRRKRFEICKNCNEEFDHENNSRNSCLRHEDMKVVDTDSSVWADHDEACHGNYEHFIDDPVYADGFMWECCDRPSTSKGCKVSQHRA